MYLTKSSLSVLCSDKTHFNVKYVALFCSEISINSIQSMGRPVSSIPHIIYCL